MTAADHANTAREHERFMWGDATTEEKRESAKEFDAALDALKAQAEAAEKFQALYEAEVIDRARLEAAEAERDRLREDALVAQAEAADIADDLIHDLTRTAWHWKACVEAAEREAQDARLARTVGIGTMKQRARAAEAERDLWHAKAEDRQTYIEELKADRDRLADALREIEDTEWGNASHEVSGPNEIAHAALARTENTP